VGEAIEEMFADRVEEQATRLAHHFDEGREFDKAIVYYTQAADAAARIYANEEADTLYGKALALSAQTTIDRDRLVHLYTKSGGILQLLGRHDEAVARYEEMEALGRERGDRAMELAALMSQATVFSTFTSRFDPARGESLSRQGLELARELEDPEAEATALWNLMLVMTFGEADYALATEYGEQAIAIARRHDLKERLAYTLNDISRDYIWAGQRDKAWAVLEESRALWRELGNMPMLGDNLQATADGHFMAGDYAKSVEAGEEGLEISLTPRNMWGEAGQITLRTRREGENIAVDIEDDGPGIPADVQTKVFDSFFTTKEPGKGTGLGLDISYNIVVQKHRGDIKLSSEPGRTTFKVVLPMNFEAVGG
jgi:tetratricopeptide (TPR) repeat protein